MSLPCRQDKGRAIIAAYRDPKREDAYIQFADKSIYWIFPFWQLDWDHFKGDNGSPGCWFNQVITKRRRYSYKRLANWPFGSKKGWDFLRWQTSPKI